MKIYDRTMSINIQSIKERMKHNVPAKGCLFGDSIEEFNGFLNRLKALIEEERCLDPYKGLRIAELVFKYPYLGCVDYHVIALAVMRLLIKYCYSTVFDRGRFTIGYRLQLETGCVNFTIGSAISLKDPSGNAVPNKQVYVHIMRLVAQKAEEYPEAVLSGLCLRMYMEGMQVKDVTLTYEEIDTKIWELINAGDAEPQEVPAQEVPAMGGSKRRYPDHVTALKPTGKDRQPFIVADTETVLVNGVHVPYAAGFLFVYPGQAINSHNIYTEFSEDDDALFVIPEFEDRSNKLMFGFLESLAWAAGEAKIQTVYFHNFARFDGIILMKHYAKHGDKYTIKPLMRNNRLYELVVSKGEKGLKGKKGMKVVLRFRDSLHLLPSSLDTLAKTLCPELGVKGSIKHDEVEVSNLVTKRAELLEYMKQDIRLLGGVMQKAQDLYFNKFQVDVVDCLTLSALAMRIYRTIYYDPNSFPIHIPRRNEDTFIRRGYYGGHADVYIPHGTDLHYYDVNSLYPYIMKTFNMPGGKPVWYGNLEGQELSQLYGFIEAYVVCPSTITRPFLPYKDSNDTLLFPTGKFVGVYYSEELKYARSLGYTILPLRGYLFEETPSPFDGFVSSLFSLRQEARRAGHESTAYGYKILMNSLYGRFGINPKSTVTEVCDRERYDYLTQNKHLTLGDKLSEYYYIVSYHINTEQDNDSDWNPPKISAVQLAAAITACSRIHMYKYISRPDCYYTDTDSAILGSPLPEEEVSSTELGKLKLEHIVKRGIFLASKSYLLLTQDGGHILKHKGPAKHSVDETWFESQYADPSLTKQITVVDNFRVSLPTLDIARKDMLLSLGIKLGTKRNLVYDDNNIWVDTKPKEVIDFGGHDITILKYEKKLLQDQLDLKEKEQAELSAKIDLMSDQIASLQKLVGMDSQELSAQIASLQDQVASQAQMMASQAQMIAKLEAAILEDKQQSAAKLPEVPVIGPKTESPILQPTRFNHPTWGNKGKSDNKLRRVQRRLNKKANQQPKPPKDKKPP